MAQAGKEQSKGYAGTNLSGRGAEGRVQRCGRAARRTEGSPGDTAKHPERRAGKLGGESLLNSRCGAEPTSGAGAAERGNSREPGAGLGTYSSHAGAHLLPHWRLLAGAKVV